MKISRAKLLLIHFSALLIAISITGCTSQLTGVNLGVAPQPKLIPPEQFSPKTIQVPVGEIMIASQINATELPSQLFQAFHVTEDSIGRAKHKSNDFEFSIPAGDYRLRGVTTEGKYYSATKRFMPLNRDTKIGYGGLFVPNGSSQATAFYWHWFPDAPTVYQANLVPPISGTIGESILHPDQPQNGNPIATLTYAGVAGGQIRFVYKEFTERGLARPAFTQEVSLDYRPGGTYSYKNAEYVVHNADATHIRFTLNRPL